MSARAALFDLAVNRAATYRRGAGPDAPLEPWYARTRFAYRLDLARVRQALESRPQQGEWHWAGGEAGGWRPGKAPTP